MFWAKGVMVSTIMSEDYDYTAVMLTVEDSEGNKQDIALLPDLAKSIAPSLIDAVHEGEKALESGPNEQRDFGDEDDG